jgi:PAS domain S-box-containing protein
MAALGAPDYRQVFEQAPGLFLLLEPDSPRFTIIHASNAYLLATHTRKDDIVGRGLFEVFPDNPDDPGASGTRNLRASLERVLATRAPDTMAVQKYDVRRGGAAGGAFEERFWSPVNAPVLSNDGGVACIVHRVEDVTEWVRRVRAAEAQRDGGAGQRRRLVAMEAEVLGRSEELDEANRKLRTLNERLAELDQARTTFFSNVSHELRTPLALMLAPLEEILRDPARLAPEERAHLERVRRGGLRLSELVDSILEFSRIQAGERRPAFEPTDLAPLTAALTGAFQSVGRLTGVKLRVDASPLPEPIFVDREMYERIVANLVSNAFKFTRAGEVAVSLAWKGDRAELSVRDTGSGIPADELPRIFDRFYRVSDARGRKTEGSGIGLSLVQELVKLHGGSVDVASTVGEGSVFTVSLPAGSAHLPAARVRASAAGPGYRTRPRSLDDLLERAGKVAATFEPALALPGPVVPVGEEERADRPHILVAEDNEEMRGYLTWLLEQQGWRVSAFADGEAALAAARVDPPGLVLSDVMMPGMDGFALARALRESPQTRAVPIILLSAQAGEDHRIRGFEAGADEYLAKPFSTRELVARIQSQLALAEVRASTRAIEENLAVALDAARMGFWRRDTESGKTVWSDRMKALFGLRTDAEVTPDTFLSVIHPDDREPVRRRVDEALARGSDYDAETRVPLPDGSVRWIAARGRAFRDASGKPVRIAGIAMDITDLKQAREAVEREKDRALEIARFPEENPDPVLGLESDLSVRYANPSARSALGLGPGRPVPPPMLDAARAAKAERRSLRIEMPFGERHFEVHFVPAGAGVNVYGQDVTDRRRAENRLRRLYEAAMVGVVYWTVEGRITDANDKFLEMTGYSREELVAGRMNWVAMTPPEWRHLDEAALANFRATGVSPPFEKEYLRKDGGRISIIIGGALLDERRQEEGVAFIVDISDRKRIEQELRASEHRLQGVFEKAALGIVEVDREARFAAVNDRLCKMLGYSPEELIGKTLDEMTAPEDRPMTVQLASELRDGLRDRVECEKRYLRRDGTRQWAHECVTALRDEAGTFRGAIGTIEDIDARRAAEAERDRLIDALREADRRKNEFLGMLSHELRNPLSPIRNSLYILGRAAPGGEQARRALEVIERQVQHTTRLVDDLLDVTRITRGKVRLQRERVDLGELARRTVEDHRDLFANNGVHLDVRIAGEPVVVNADATRISQVIGNLLQNAAKFTHRGGETTLAVEQADGAAVVTVRDTGAGIAPEVLRRLFEPFVQADSTLDRSTGGLGLGLALVKGLAELHGGSATAHSDGVGTGATFTVRLPLERRRTPRLTVVDAGRAPPGPARRVLVIEDNADAAQTLKEALELNDHVVDVASSGSDGLDKVRALNPDVVLCDIGLPGMDGFEVAKRIRADPGVRGVALIALSGYAQEEDLERSKEAGFDLHLAKPPDLDALERAIAEVRKTAAARASATEAMAGGGSE